MLMTTKRQPTKEQIIDSITERLCGHSAHIIITMIEEAVATYDRLNKELRNALYLAKQEVDCALSVVNAGYEVDEIAGLAENAAKAQRLVHEIRHAGLSLADLVTILNHKHGMTMSTPEIHAAFSA